MSVRVAPVTDNVARCVPRHDGGFLIVTRKGQSGSSPVDLPIGAQVVVRDGLVVRPGQ